MRFELALTSGQVQRLEDLRALLIEEGVWRPPGGTPGDSAPTGHTEAPLAQRLHGAKSATPSLRGPTCL